MKYKIFTIPNLLAFFRVIAGPIVMWNIIYDNNKTAFLILSFAFITDLFDGLIARKFNQKSLIGSILDPIADKVLMGFVLFGICIRNNLLFWIQLFGILALLYVLMFILFYPLFLKKGVKINFVGKTCVFINCFVILALVLQYNVWLVRIFTICLIFPQFVYFLQFTRKVGEENHEVAH